MAGGTAADFEAVLENKPFILNVYRTLSREQIENYLFRLVYDLIMGVVEEKAAGLRVTQQQKQFVAEFYKYSFVCVMLDWIRGGMKVIITPSSMISARQCMVDLEFSAEISLTLINILLYKFFHFLSFPLFCK